MRRLYLQKPLDAEALRIINAWQQRMDAPPESGDRLWAVVDGAVVGDAGARSLQLAYGEPVRAFDGSPLADYEELGILLWPVAAMSAHDGLAALGQAVDASPSLSIVRTLKPVDDLCRLLSWLACASTTDDMRLYLRIADTRVLAGLLRHITAAQRAMLQDTVREWVLADRTGALTRSFSAEASAVSAGAANTGIVLDDLQYNALMQDMEADMLHAELRRTKPHLHISRSGAEIQEWLRTVLGRAKALGLKSLADHAAFAGLALRAAGEFEAAPELADTWFRAKSGACSLHDAIGLWGGVQWQALGRFSNTGPNAARRQG